MRTLTDYIYMLRPSSAGPLRNSERKRQKKIKSYHFGGIKTLLPTVIDGPLRLHGVNILHFRLERKFEGAKSSSTTASGLVTHGLMRFWFATSGRSPHLSDGVTLRTVLAFF